MASFLPHFITTTMRTSLALAVFFTFALASCSGALGGESLSLTGFIQSSATDDNDIPTEIFIFDGKEEYHIPKGSKQKELVDYVDHKISVTGEVSEDWNGKKIFKIEEYKILD